MIRDYITLDGFTLVLLFNIIIVSLLKNIESIKFDKFLNIFWNQTYLKFYRKEQKIISGFNIILNLNLILSISLLIQIVSSFNSFNRLYFDLRSYLINVIIVFSFLLLRYLIDSYLVWTFDLKKQTRKFIFHKNSFNKFIGLILVINNSLLIFCVPTNYYIINLSLASILIIYVLGYYISIKLNDNLIYSNIFYFILYLCALEIVPILMVYKFLS